MTQDSVASLQQTTVPLEEREMPSERNFLMYIERHENGLTVEEIAEKYEIAAKTVYHHIEKVQDYLRGDFRTRAESLLKTRLGKALKALDHNLEHNKELTLNKYLDRMAYPKEQKGGIAFQLNVKEIVQGMHAGKYEDNVEIIEVAN